jgi:hypothetical protein
MGFEQYYELKNSEQEQFRQIVNFLLNSNYMLGYNYANKNKLRTPNRDYQFLLRHYDLFLLYFEIAGYELKKFDDYSVVALSNIYKENHLRLDKFTTMTIYFLRLVYDEFKEKNPNSEVVYLTTEAIVKKMIEVGVVTKKPPVSMIVETFRILNRYNIINRLDKTFEDFSATIVLLPTIIYVISNEKINAIHSAVFASGDDATDSEENESKDEVEV